MAWTGLRCTFRVWTTSRTSPGEQGSPTATCCCALRWSTASTTSSRLMWNACASCMACTRPRREPAWSEVWSSPPMIMCSNAHIPSTSWTPGGPLALLSEPTTSPVCASCHGRWRRGISNNGRRWGSPGSGLAPCWLSVLAGRYGRATTLRRSSTATLFWRSAPRSSQHRM